MNDAGIAERPTTTPSMRPGPLHGDSTPERDVLLESILEEIRMLRREQQHEDFSIARLAGAVAQAFALCSIGWGLFAWIDATPDTLAAAATTATIRLLAGIGFQLMALTCFIAARR